MRCHVRDLPVFYRAYGEGRPLLLLHGWGLDHRHMAHEMEPLFRGRRGWRRIYPDLPGMGRTPARDWIVNMDAILGVVVRLADALVGPQRWVLGGMSAGGLLARGVVHHRAEQLDGLLLTAPVIVADDAQRDRPAPSSHVPERGSSSGDERAPAVPRTPEATRLTDALQRYYAPASDSADHAFLDPIRQDPRRYGLGDLDSPGRPFPAPTLILTGRQDSSVGFRDAWRIVEAYPRSTFVALDGAGHTLAIEQQRLFRALVSEWLDRVEAYADGG